MGKIVEEGKKKKKGRPSLLDLQKRNLREEQKLRLSRNAAVSTSTNSATYSSNNYKSATSPSLRRSTRHNQPSPSSPEDEDDGNSELNEKRREEKLKLVLKFPSSQKSEANSTSSGVEEEATTRSNHKKRKINAIGDGSGFGGGTDKREESVSGQNPTSNVQDLGPSVPLPDKKLLLFILDRIQKKDTYGAFSEPVDPNELPDYHEIIEHPMDFSTIRKKLSAGAYTNLEQFEKDVFLICSNAMLYNAPDTIYFRQARSIQELAKKNFENLRQDSDNEQELKVPRRGRPPTKNLIKTQGRSPLDRSGSEFSSDATLVSGGERTTFFNNNFKKGPHISDKSGFADASGQLQSARNDSYWLSENRLERNDEAAGSMLKGNAVKHGKKQFVLDENRRNTYEQFHPSARGHEASVLATFNAERKHLVAVGLVAENGYARSLIRFAANMGPVAWKIASKRMELTLLPGVKFGPGWVGENDIPPQRPLLHSSTPQGQAPPSQPLSLSENSCGPARPCPVESNEKSSDKPEKDNIPEIQVSSIHSASEGNANSLLPPSTVLPKAALKSEADSGRAEAVEEINSQAGFNMLSRSISTTGARPPFQICQNSVIAPGMNGCNLPVRTNKLVAAPRPGRTDFHSSEMVNMVSRTNTDSVQPATTNRLSAPINFAASFSKSRNAEPEASTPELQPVQSCKGLSMQPKPESELSPQEKPDSVAPDLNVKFQSCSSPNSTVQPDLALQL